MRATDLDMGIFRGWESDWDQKLERERERDRDRETEKEREG